MSVKLYVSDIDISQVRGWSDSVNAANAILEGHNRNRWALGRIINNVETEYGKQSLLKFSVEVKLAKLSTLYEYGKVTSFYPENIEGEFPDLDWSYFKYAMRYKDVERAIEALEIASNEDMNLTTFAKFINEALGKPTPPQQIYSGDGVIVAIDEASGDITFRLGDLTRQLAQGERFIVKLYTEAE